MTAAVADRKAPQIDVNGVLVLPVAAATTIYAGTLVALNTSGYAVPASASASLQVLGWAQTRADNSGGGAGAISVNVMQGAAAFVNGDGIAAVNAGSLVYAQDDQTVALSSSSGTRPAAGVVLGMLGTLVEVDVGASTPAGNWGAGLRTVQAVAPLGTSADAAHIQAALTAMADVGGKVILKAGTYTVTSAVTGASNVVVEFMPGAVLDISTGVTVTMGGVTYDEGVILTGTGTLAITRAGQRPTIATAMLCGDSMTRGGSAAMDDTTLGWRGQFWDYLQSHGSGLRLLGQTVGGLYWVSTTAKGGCVKLGDWHVSATGGHTLAQINTAAGTEETAVGAADAYFLLGGENDNDGSAGCVATILAGINTFITARKAANPNALIFIGDLTYHASPLSGYANKNTRRDSVNSQLAASVAALGYQGVHVVACGSLMTSAHLASDGQHPNGAGYALIGRAFAEAFVRYARLAGLPGNRPPYFRKAKARLSITATDNTANANITSSGSDGLLPTGNESWSFGLVFKPTDLSSASQQRVVSIGATFASGIYLFSERGAGDSSGRSLSLYIAGVGYSVSNEALKQDKWTAITVSYDAARTELTIWAFREGGTGAGGKPVSSCVSLYRGVPTLALSLGAGVISFGYHASYTVVAKGLKGDFWLARGHVATEAEAAAFYLEGELPQGVTAYYPMDDGSGTALAVAPGYTTMPAGVISGAGASWSAAAAVAEPWHREADA
jgi:lysophospholipase L1-like esterase